MQKRSDEKARCSGGTAERPVSAKLARTRHNGRRKKRPTRAEQGHLRDNSSFLSKKTHSGRFAYIEGLKAREPNTPPRSLGAHTLDVFSVQSSLH